MKNHPLLIIDDDPAIRGMLSMTLAQAGYEVAESHSAQDAIEQIQNQAFQVVLLDMGMPPNEHGLEEGISVLNYISGNQINAKVIVLTGQNAEQASYSAIRHGAFDFLSKPVAPEALLQSIKRAELFWNQSAEIKDREGVQKIELDLPLAEGVKAARNSAEEKLLKQVLKDTDFNVHEVARRLNLKRENVYYLIKKYGIERA